MRADGNAVLSAETAAKTAIHSLEPSWATALTSFFSHWRRENTRSDRSITPIRKPFSSTLYVFDGATL